MSSDNSYLALRNAILKNNTCQRIQTLRSLIEAGSDVNSCNSHGYSLVTIAASKGYVECVRLLLKAGVDVNNSDTEGNTALIEAARDGNVDCARVLLEAGAEVNHSDNEKQTALIEASRDGNTDCARVLLEAGADVNHSDDDGNTSIMVAAWFGHNECVQLLLEAGASVHNVDTNGQTVLLSSLIVYDYIYMSSGDENTDAQTTKTCLKLLINAGADINARTLTNIQPIHYALRLWPHFKFPAEYLISENCSLSQASYDKIMTGVDGNYLTEGHRLDMLKLLFACGLPRHLCQSFIVEQETSVINWVERMASQPNTLKSICVFEIRKSLGQCITSKVAKLNLPNVIQNLILLKGILSLECFI